MTKKFVLILDYSTDKSEAAQIARWLPTDAEIQSVYVDAAGSFSADLSNQEFTHVIHSGSALSITEDSSFTEGAISFIRYCAQIGIKQMGICYGHQLLNRALIGPQAVRKSLNGLEVGWREVHFDLQSLEFPGINEREVVWQYHYDEVCLLPDGSTVFASNDHSEIQGFYNPGLRLFGTQFHPEFDLVEGNRIFMKDREILTERGYDVDIMAAGGPSLDSGRIFFGHFMELFGD